jgi:hypothetical protein
VYEVTLDSTGFNRTTQLVRIQNYDTPLYWNYINWYLPGYNTSTQPIAQVQNSGDLSFVLTPNNITEDYDWAVYNLTNASCADIFSNPALSVSCNFSADGGATGPNGGSASTSQGAAGTPFNATIPVVAGETYVINVSNYSTSVNGYTLDLTNSTASIYDNTPPRILSVNSFNGCAGNQIVVNFFCCNIF